MPDSTIPDTTRRDLAELNVFLQLLKRRFKLVIVIGIVLLVSSLTIALLWPRTYEATVTVFPVSNTEGSSLSDYAGLASLAGINLPTSGSGSSPSKTVNALLQSRLLFETVVTDLKLTERVKVKAESEKEAVQTVVELLRRGTKTKDDPKTGVITIMLEYPDATIAQDVANHLIVALDHLLAEKSFTTNKKKRDQLDRQIEEQGKKVHDFQRQMANFQTETSLLNPQSQAGQAMEAYTMMVQQKMNLELQLETAKSSYSPDNPRVLLLQTQVANLENQIGRVKNEVTGDLPSLKMAPENMIRYQNLTRDLEISTKIYAGLLASLEQSKLEADQDQVYIEVLDEALLPQSGKPSRVLLFVLVYFAGAVISLSSLYYVEKWHRSRIRKSEVS